MPIVYDGAIGPVAPSSSGGGFVDSIFSIFDKFTDKATGVYSDWLDYNSNSKWIEFEQDERQRQNLAYQQTNPPSTFGVTGALAGLPAWVPIAAIALIAVFALKKMK